MLACRPTDFRHEDPTMTTPVLPTAEQIQAARLVLGMTRDEHAALMGISRTGLQKMEESGFRKARFENIARMIEVLEARGVMLLPADDGGRVGLRWEK